jgi:thiamine pyrophosphokinase
VAQPNGVLIANAPLRWTPRLTALVAGADVLLAADGGANHLARIGLRPVSVIGDLDSISGPTRGWLGDSAMVERPDQDRTDLDKALEYAFDDLGLGKLTVLAATGGRVDHDAGNLGLLARLALGTRLVYESDAHRLLAGTGDLKLESVPGETWSFWTYDSAIRVTLEGVRWPVESAALDAGGRPSISNEAIQHEVRVRAEGGAVIVMRQHDASI